MVMLEIFELVLNETLVGRNNLVNISIKLIDNNGIEVTFYLNFLDRETFWYDCNIIRESVFFLCKGLNIYNLYYVHTRFMFDGG